MKTLLILLLLIGFTLLMVSQWLSPGRLFARWKTFHKGTYNGTPFVLQEIEIKGFSSNRLERRFRLGNLPAAEITALTTDWGPPYSNDIFGQASYCYTAENIPAYRNEEKDPMNYEPFSHEYTMLYLSSRQFSKADYEQYCAFMKSEWPAIDQKYGNKPYSTFPHIIGLVYAQPDDIAKVYKGRYKAYSTEVEDVSLIIEPDGRVKFRDDESYQDYNSGLSTRVQMPGKRLYLDTNPKHDGLHSLAALRTFKDAQGRSPDMDFQIIERFEP